MSEGVEKVKERLRRASILGGRGRIERFLDGPGAKDRGAVHLIFAEETFNPDAPEPSSGIDRVDHEASEFRLLDLEALVTMKLTSYRRKDQVHLLDMLEIGQIDASWVERVPPSLRRGTPAGPRRRSRRLRGGCSFFRVD